MRGRSRSGFIDTYYIEEIRSLDDKEKIKLLEKQVELLEKIVELQKSIPAPTGPFVVPTYVPYHPWPPYPEYPKITW